MFVSRVRAALAVAFCTLSLAACGGGGHSIPSVQPQGAASQARGAGAPSAGSAVTDSVTDITIDGTSSLHTLNMPGTLKAQIALPLRDLPRGTTVRVHVKSSETASRVSKEADLCGSFWNEAACFAWAFAPSLQFTAEFPCPRQAGAACTINLAGVIVVLIGQGVTGPYVLDVTPANTPSGPDTVQLALSTASHSTVVLSYLGGQSPVTVAGNALISFAASAIPPCAVNNSCNAQAVVYSNTNPNPQPNAVGPGGGSINANLLPTAPAPPAGTTYQSIVYNGASSPLFGFGPAFYSLTLISNGTLPFGAPTLAIQPGPPLPPGPPQTIYTPQNPQLAATITNDIYLNGITPQTLNLPNFTAANQTTLNVTYKPSICVPITNSKYCDSDPEDAAGLSNATVTVNHGEFSLFANEYFYTGSWHLFCTYNGAPCATSKNNYAFYIVPNTQPDDDSDVPPGDAPADPYYSTVNGVTGPGAGVAKNYTWPAQAWPWFDGISGACLLGYVPTGVTFQPGAGAVGPAGSVDPCAQYYANPNPKNPIVTGNVSPLTAAHPLVEFDLGAGNCLKAGAQAVLTVYDDYGRSDTVTVSVGKPAPLAAVTSRVHVMSTTSGNPSGKGSGRIPGGG